MKKKMLGKLRPLFLVPGLNIGFSQNYYTGDNINPKKLREKKVFSSYKTHKNLKYGKNKTIITSRIY